ncbi:MAG: hypothetical protein LBH97_05480 [Treponema sp.]|nr:hypothetical protein [Treponema sp.]
MKIPGLSAPVPEKPLQAPVQNNSSSVNTAAARLGSAESPHNAASRTQPQGLPAPALSSLLKTLGLPADRLSASIISFARFFSLPLEPGLLAKVRQQAHLPGQASMPGQAEHPAQTPAGRGMGLEPSAGAILRSREMLSLGAVAAADKGVELSEKALAEYAAAIDPDQGGGQNAEGRKKEQHNKNQDDKKADKQAPLELSPVQLKELFLESAEKTPLLDILNRLPGKNGQRWLVFPFSFTENGSEYRVALKILLAGEMAGTAYPAQRPVNRLSLDIVKSGETYQRWLFVMDSAGETQRLQLYLQPVRPKARQRLVRELSRRLGLPPERVLVHDGEFSGEFPFAPDSRNEPLCPIDETV